MKKEIFILMILPLISLGCCFALKANPWFRRSSIQIALNQMAQEVCACRQSRSEQDCTELVRSSSPQLVLSSPSEVGRMRLSFLSWTSVVELQGETCILTQD